MLFVFGYFWRFGPFRAVAITGCALLAAFAQLAQGAVGYWTDAVTYSQVSLFVFTVFVGLPSVLLGWALPDASWRPGIWVVWPTALFEGWLAVTGVFPGASLVLLVLFVGIACGLAWVAATVRISVRALLGRPPLTEAEAAEARARGGWTPMTDEEKRAEASWERPSRRRRRRR